MDGSFLQTVKYVALRFMSRWILYPAGSGHLKPEGFVTAEEEADALLTTAQGAIDTRSEGVRTVITVNEISVHQSLSSCRQ